MSRRAPAVLVLAAGLGTRLRPLTLVRAKAAVPVAGRPLVSRVLDALAGAGVHDVVVNLHHLPHTITAQVGDGSPWGLRVRYSWENPVLGSAGGPRHALPLLPGDPFVIVNADTLTDVDIGALVETHRRSGARVTMALTTNPARDRYGGVLVDDDGRVTGFTRAGDARESYHFVGVQAVDRDVFAPLDDGTPAESVNGVYRQLIAAAPGAVQGMICEAGFRDIGTVRDYLETSVALAASERGGIVPPGEGTHIHPTARLVRAAVWDRVTVGADCELTDCVVTDDVTVPPGTRLAGCAVVPAACGAGLPGAVALGAAAVVDVRGLAERR